MKKCNTCVPKCSKPAHRSPGPPALLNVHMDALEAYLQRPADRQEREAEDAVRALGTLSALLAAFPGDMEPLFQDDCINFFIALAGSLEGMGESAPR